MGCCLYCFRELNILINLYFFVSLKQINVLGSSRDEINYSFENF